jgi:hypothetical protein
VGICDYPTGYVEPYPDFYAAVKDYADFGLQMLESLDLEQVTKGVLREDFAGEDEETWRAALHWVSQHFASEDEGTWSGTLHWVSNEVTFFKRLSEAAAQLQTLAQKELDGESFTEDEQSFVKSVVVLKSIGLCGELWDGWYANLVGWDQTPAIVADVHTNLKEGIGEVGVLHTATGHPVLEALLVECGEGSTIYVGPAFSYYELHMTGQPLHRLNDEEWRERLQYPQQGPAWTKSFRQAVNARPKVLELPRA